MEWEQSLPSSVVTTLLVLLLDVVALLLFDTAFLRVAAFLNARELYDAHNAINVSDVWLESLSGRSHGPLWFRKLHVLLKLALLACSITVGLSIDGFTENRFVRLEDQTILVPHVRRIADVGITQFSIFSTDVLFVKAAYGCGYSDYNDSTGLNTRTIWNARALEPVHHDLQSMDIKAIPLECLSNKSNFSVSPVRYRVVNHTNAVTSRSCIKSVPNLTEIQNGTFNVSMSSTCPWHSLRLKCSSKFLGACALTMEMGDQQVLCTWRYNFETKQHHFLLWETSMMRRKRDEETLLMMAKYMDAGLRVPPQVLDHITLFRAANRSILQVQGRSFRTRINARLFVPGFAVISAIVSLLIVTALISHAIMVRKKRLNYALGLRMAEIARFARRDAGDILGESLFVKMHLDFPRLTLSGVVENCGSWDTGEVMKASRLLDRDNCCIFDESTRTRSLGESSVPA